MEAGGASGPSPKPSAESSPPLWDAGETNVAIFVTTSDPAELDRRTIIGLVGGAGLDPHTGRLHVLPEMRYTSWTDEHFTTTGRTALNSNRNQLELLQGITF